MLALILRHHLVIKISDISKISPSHYSISLAKDTMPSTRDFILEFEPISSSEPYVEIYGEDSG